MQPVEQRGCAVLRIASPRCNCHCWHLLPITERSCGCNARKTTNKTALKWCYSTITPARTLLLHSANLIKNTIQELGWEVIPRPPYSPDLAPSDFRLFRSQSSNFQGTFFLDENVLRTCLDDLNSKPRDFYRCGNRKNYCNVDRLL